MSLSRAIPRNSKLPKAEIEVAHTRVTRFHKTGWAHHCSPHWVLDEINQGQQKQRVEKGKVFTRLSGVAAFYAPKCSYHELQSAGESIHVSFMVFSAWGDLAVTLRRLVGKRGWCHILDTEHLIGKRLQLLGDLVFRRRPGFELLAHAAMLELLGMLLVAPRVGPTTREVCSETRGKERDLVKAVEYFVRDHVSEPLSVLDLAVHVKMSLPTFARTYPRVAGETPSRTVRRLKVEAAKRLLLGDGLSIKECALRLGFSSEFHFSRLFTRLEGLPPSDYVKSLSRGRSA